MQILITGANRGIGFELAKQLSKEGNEIFSLVRSSCSELDQIAKQVIKNVDLTSLSDIQKAREEFTGGHLDMIINNAGTWSEESINDLEQEATYVQMRNTMEINAFAPLKVTSIFLPLLNKSSKLIFITSRMGSIADNSSGGRYAYRMSKAALNMAGKSLAEDLKNQGIAVGVIHPGFVKTRMTGFSGMIEAQESAQNIIHRIKELNLQNTGTFWHSKGEILPW